MELVTGGTGLLGSHIVEQLRLRDRPVRALVRRGSNTEWLRSQGVELVEGDITDAESLQHACRGVTNIFHAAARVGDWGPWQEFVDITIHGTRNVIDAAAQAGVRRLLHISSISVYGHVDGEGKVFDETAPLGVNLHNWSYYSRAKVEAEKLVWEAHHAGRIRATVIRPSWIYGPRDRTTIARLAMMIKTRKAKLIGDGNNRLNVVYAGNAAEGAIIATDAENAVGQAYNCSNDGEMTQRQYYNMLADELGAPPVERQVPYKLAHNAAFILEIFGHLFRTRKPPMITRYAVWLIGRRCYFSTEKARRELNWQSTVPYSTGIPNTIRWYRDHVQSNGRLPRS